MMRITDIRNAWRALINRNADSPKKGHPEPSVRKQIESVEKTDFEIPHAVRTSFYYSFLLFKALMNELSWVCGQGLKNQPWE